MQFEQRTLKFYWPKFRPMLQNWLPTKGNVLFTLLVVGSLIWAQNGGILNLFAAPNAQTVSTGTIPYQGRLANAAGDPLTETVNMSFRLYNATTGGAPLWTEQWTGSNGVQVSDGLFNVMLGSLTSIDQAVITGNSNLFLGITVGTDDEMTPRVQMGSVPYAVQALTVPDGSITSEKLSPEISLEPPNGSITNVKIANNSVSAEKLVNGSVTAAKLANGSVIAAKIADGAITPTKLNSAVKFAAIDSGYIHHGSQSSGWTLHEGNGERTYTANITFNHPFEKTPRVMVSRSYTDIRGNADQRFLITPRDITKNGFKLVFKTWGTAQVNSATAGWIAYTSP